MWNAAELGAALAGCARLRLRRRRPAGHDWPLAQAASATRYVARLNDLYAANLAKRNVELVRGRAAFLDARTVSVGGRALSGPAHRHRDRRTADGAARSAGAELGITSDGFFELEALPGARRGRRARLHRRGAGRHLRRPGCADHAGAPRGDGAARLRSHARRDDARDAARVGRHARSPVPLPARSRAAPTARSRARCADGRAIGPFDCVLWAVGRAGAGRGSRPASAPA